MEKQLIGLFIKKGLPLMSMNETEKAIGEWMVSESIYKSTILPHLINQKLLKNEAEY